MPVIGNPNAATPTYYNPQPVTPTLPEEGEAGLEALEKLNCNLDFMFKNRNGYAGDLDLLLSCSRLHEKSETSEDSASSPIVRTDDVNIPAVTAEVYEDHTLHPAAEMKGALTDGEADRNIYYVRLGEHYFVIQNHSGCVRECTLEVSRPLTWKDFVSEVTGDAQSTAGAR